METRRDKNKVSSLVVLMKLVYKAFCFLFGFVRAVRNIAKIKNPFPFPTKKSIKKG
jgi:hypothetical protein